MKAKILVFGSEGQLGKCLQDLAKHIDSAWHFSDIDKLDITDLPAVEKFISVLQPQLVVNCSAYTAVDNAETESDIAFLVNADAVGNFARVCKNTGSRFLHVSTDYVFDGQKNTPYTETDRLNPTSVYGASKRKGEELAIEANNETMIIRTSWLYSEYGRNFAKTMAKLGCEKPELKVIYDQTGTPTYAGDLAQVIIKVTADCIENKQWYPGVFHYSNEGVCSWFDFATQIMRLKKLSCHVVPITSEEFPSKVKRPAYSVLHKQKIKKTLGIEIPYWLTSLEKCLDRMQ